jgi:phage terminase large subunit
MEAILQAHEHAGANTLLLRRTFPELEQSLLLYFRRDVPRELYRSFNEAKHVVTWWNDSTTRFGYCAREADVYQYQGAEFLFIGIDELTLFTLRQWQFLTSRNRCPIPGAFPSMAAATNPGNIGHAWVKALWIDRQPAPGMEHPEEYDAADYDFIAARVWDNPIYAADENYLKTLRALPTHLRRAFLDGDWTVFAGQYFDRFDFSRHVVRPEAIPFQTWWPRWISIDWGFEHPAAAYWHGAVPAGAMRGFARATEVPASPEAPASGNWGNESACRQGPTSSTNTEAAKPIVVSYREFVTHRTPPRELAREIIARSLEAGGGLERIDAIYLSPDAFARRTDEASIAEQMGDVFVAAGFPRPVPADDDRVGGWMLMYQMLDAGEWVIGENCAELLRTLPNLVRDPARVEDVEKMDGDDPADAARYGLKSRYGARRGASEHLPYEARIAARITATDPTVRAIQARKAQIEESRRVAPVSFARHGGQGRRSGPPQRPWPR